MGKIDKVIEFVRKIIATMRHELVAAVKVVGGKGNCGVSRCE
jgi:hypothetical protein